MKVSLILAVVSMMVTLDMSYGDCLPAAKNICNSAAKAAVDIAQTNAQYCTAKNIYITCIKSCDDAETLTAGLNELLAEKGIKCGSVMVTLSGTMVMLMLFTTLRHFF